MQVDEESLNYYLENGIMDCIHFLVLKCESNLEFYNVISTAVWSLFTICEIKKSRNESIYEVGLSLIQAGKMMQTLRVIMSEALIESDYVAVFKMLGLFAREKDLALMMALEFKFQEVTVRCLQSCDEQVCTSCSRYISNSLSHLEEVDEVFLNAGLLENISMLHEKQRLKEFKKLKENCTLIMVNLLSSSSQNFTRVIKSPLIGICLQLLTEEQIKPRVSDSSDKPILFNLIDVFRIFYLKADDEHLFNFTKMHSDIIQVVLKCTGIQVDPKQVIMCLII